MNCEICGSDAAALNMSILGPGIACLCGPCFRSWRRQLWDYGELVAAFWSTSSSFAKAIGPFPSTTGMEEDVTSLYWTLREHEMTLMKLWEEYTNARRLSNK